MSHIRVLVCRVEDGPSERMTELASFDVPATDLATAEPGTVLDELESRTRVTGQAVLRAVLQAQWETTEEQAAAAARRQFSP